ncbi:MAG: anti-sigma factor family protein [Chloroflexota bacterium]
MNHRPFEDWLLDDQFLAPEQKRELDIHLRTCKSCTAIAEANLALRSARVVAPAPGFSARWQERLVLARQAQRRRTLIGTLVFSIGGLLLLALLAGPTIASVIGSPAEWLSALVRVGLFTYSVLMATLEAGSVLFRVLPGFVPPFVWLVMLSTLGGLGLLWSVSIWRLTRAPQGVQLL